MRVGYKTKDVGDLMPDSAGNNNLENSKEVTINSRFGEVTVHMDNAVFFSQGLLGLPDDLHFVLADVPGKDMGQFKLLQCLNDHSLSFVVLPLDLDNTLIEKNDLDEACRILNVTEKDTLAMVIVSVQRTPENIKLSANLRAPIIIDVEDKAGIQYVFPSNRYEICHVISN